MVSRRIALIVLPLLISTAGWAQNSGIYKHRSESGAVLYSDKPEGPRGSTTEQLPGLPITSIAAPSRDDDGQSPDESADEELLSGYQQLLVLSPTAGQKVRSNNGDLTVSIGLEPPLQPGDVAMVLLDGTPRAQIVAPDSSATIETVDRGEHRVQVVVLNANQAPIIRSDEQTFFMHRFSALTAPR